jgi:hypothetical protein
MIKVLKVNQYKKSLMNRDFKPIQSLENLHETLISSKNHREASWKLHISLDELTKAQLLLQAQAQNFATAPLDTIANWDQLTPCHRRVLYCDLLGYTPQETAEILDLSSRSVTTYLVVAKKDTNLDYKSRYEISRKLFHATKANDRYAKQDRLFEFVSSKTNPKIDYDKHRELYQFLDDVIRFIPGSSKKSKAINQRIVEQGIMKGLNDQEILQRTRLDNSVLSNRKAKIKSWLLDVLRDYFSFKEFFEKPQEFIEIFQYNKEQRKLFLAYLGGQEPESLKSSTDLSIKSIKTFINRMKKTLGEGSTVRIHEENKPNNKPYLERLRYFLKDQLVTYQESYTMKSQLKDEEQILLDLHLNNLSQRQIAEYFNQQHGRKYNQPTISRKLAKLKSKMNNILRSMSQN